ncbi:M14-type cytosolic carboxypeptidase [Rhodoferax sp.]|uniref:M14 family metallopeptidase n=1 Tax=Rhodoferax sp. TaxID=50421 RepID=UPI0025FDA32B|nr:M14-type cytosolic carboxypeptidase [Rhodoferax sp.]
MNTLHISSQFDAGAITVVSLADPQDIQLQIRPDNASAFAQWFYFCLQGAAGVPVVLRFLNAGQSAYPPGWDGYQMVASTDRRRWFRVPCTYDGQVMTVRTTPTANRIYFAYFEPYSYERHLDLLGTASLSDLVDVQHLGATHQGRDITLLHIRDVAATGTKKKVWLIARQHPGETMAEWFAEGFLQRLLDRDDPTSRSLLQHCEFFVVPNMNPDGAALGNLRTNAVGTNLNREWQEPSVEKSPEVFHVRQKMQQVGLDLFLDAHGDENLPYNFVVGTEATPGYSPRIEALQDTFKAAWLAASPDFQTAIGYPRAAPGQANLSLATNWVGQNFNCLAFTIEMPFKDNANLPDARSGWSGARSKKLGASVLSAVLAVTSA